MKMHNPPHPGEILRGLCLEPMGISITEAAEALGVTRKTLKRETTTLRRCGLSGAKIRYAREIARQDGCVASGLKKMETVPISCSSRKRSDR